MTMLDHTQVQEQMLIIYVGVSPFWTTHHTQLGTIRFSSLPKMMEYLRRHHYGLENEVRTLVRLWFHNQEAQFYCGGLMNITQGVQTKGAHEEKQPHTVKPKG